MEGRKEAQSGERPFASELSGQTLSGIQNGVLRSLYRGVPFLKSPFDIGLYLQLFSRSCPRTVVEIGTRHGGSALWFADQMTAHLSSRNVRVVSVDIDQIARVSDSRIEFLEGDAKALGSIMPPGYIAALPRPLLVVEDSSHRYEDTLAVLEFFHAYLAAGEFIVVEDGVVSQLPGENYEAYLDGPNRAVTDFLNRHSPDYLIDTSLCDHYGFNVTYNPNGWLRRR
jgi:cephalosporin hydroxylase